MVDGVKEDLVSCYDSLSVPAVPATAALGFPPGGLGPGRHILAGSEGVEWSGLECFVM